jgi:hypothetical protein
LANETTIAAPAAKRTRHARMILLVTPQLATGNRRDGNCISVNNVNNSI